MTPADKANAALTAGPDYREESVTLDEVDVRLEFCDGEASEGYAVIYHADIHFTHTQLLKITAARRKQINQAQKEKDL